MKTILVNDTVYKLPELDAMEISYLFEWYHKIDNNTDRSIEEGEEMIRHQKRIEKILESRQGVEIEEHYSF